MHMLKFVMQSMKARRKEAVLKLEVDCNFVCCIEHSDFKGGKRIQKSTIFIRPWEGAG
jgi:hypothetical protein